MLSPIRSPFHLPTDHDLADFMADRHHDLQEAMMEEAQEREEEQERE